MIGFRPLAGRGPAESGWLQSRPRFSFGSRCDPLHSGLPGLPAINEEHARARSDFDPQRHRGMERFSSVLGGAVDHPDAMGGRRPPFAKAEDSQACGVRGERTEP